MSKLTVSALLCFLFLPFCQASVPVTHNVTRILNRFPAYSVFNSLLTRYGVASQINSRTSITVLCPKNAILSPVISSLGSDPDTLFAVLSYHVLLDFYDRTKLQDIVNQTVLVTTLFQTTGRPAGSDGFVNITVVDGSAKVGWPVEGAALTATIGAKVDSYPFFISLLDINAVLLPIGVQPGAPSPAPARINITRAISQAGNYTTFLSLLKATGVDQIFQDHDVPPGITIFVPTNAAFDKLPENATARLTAAEKVALLEYHALPSFYPMEALQTLVSSPQNTLASGSGAAAYVLKVSTKGKGLTPVLHTGYNKVSVGGTLYTQNPVAIFSIDAVLMPSEIYGNAPTASPLPAPASSPSPASSSSSPSSLPSPASSPSPSSHTPPSPSPSSLPLSPPAPPPDDNTDEESPSPSPDSNPNLAAPALHLARFFTILAPLMLALPLI